MAEENKKLEQAKMYVNQVAQRRVIAQMQAQFMNGGLDEKRSKAWYEYGYPVEVSFDNTLHAYRRNPFAYAGVNKRISRTWLNTPVIRERDDSNELSAWEKEADKIFNTSFFRQFKEADKRRLIGKYSGLLLYFDDFVGDAKWGDELAIDGKRSLRKVQPIWENSLKPILGIDGYPSRWQVTLKGLNGGIGEIIEVHPDRIFILGDYTPDGMSYLEPVYNNLVNLEKIQGGSGESFLKNAARQVAINFKEDVKIEDVAKRFGIEDTTELEEHFNAVVDDLNAGNDTMLLTQGADVQTLVTSVPDPKNHFDMNTASCAIGFSMPLPIYLGANLGDRASQENEIQWSKTCEEIRDNDLTWDIERFVDKLMDLKVIDFTYQYFVIWERLVNSSQIERLTEAKLMAEINQAQTVVPDGFGVYDKNDIRQVTGYDPIESVEEELPEYDADISQ